MIDPFASAAFSSRSLGDFKIHNMILYPPAWTAASIPVSLRWEMLPFKSSKLNDVPDDKRGVYSFVVQPGIASHPACSYLLYVGKTGRNFRQRYREYLADQAKGIKSRRPTIAGMLSRWPDHMWFCYAHIGDVSKIQRTEAALLSAYLPPANVEMPGQLRKKMKFLLGV